MVRLMVVMKAEQMAEQMVDLRVVQMVGKRDGWKVEMKAGCRALMMAG